MIQPATKTKQKTNQEIEIKIKTTNNYLQKLEAWLQENATFQGEEHHKEVYLDNPNTTFFFMRPNGLKDALKYLRVRFLKQGGSVCFKDWYEDPQTGKTTHCDEYETHVANPEKMLALLEQLGYTNKTFVEKKRRKFRAGDYEIVIDDVKNLGTFFEIELKRDFSDVQVALKELTALLVKTIGITEYWIQTRGYASHLRNPGFEFGEYKIHEKQMP